VLKMELRVTRCRLRSTAGPAGRRVGSLVEVCVPRGVVEQPEEIKNRGMTCWNVLHVLAELHGWPFSPCLGSRDPRGYGVADEAPGATAMRPGHGCRPNAYRRSRGPQTAGSRSGLRPPLLTLGTPKVRVHRVWPSGSVTSMARSGKMIEASQFT